MLQEIYSHTFENGLTLVADRMTSVRSAAFNFLIPAGAMYEPEDRLGLASLTCELIPRGAGSRNSRELSDALDSLGVDRGESVGLMNMNFSGSCLSRELLAALKIYGDMLQRPHLPEEELAAAQALVLQDIHSLADDPQRQTLIALKKNYYPPPINRDTHGTESGVQSSTIADVRNMVAQFVQPQDVILSVAGDFEWQALRETVGEIFKDWKPKPRPPYQPQPSAPRSVHIPREIDQTQITFAVPSVPMNDPDFYNARGIVGVLSLDMSSRLFMNVREKYGLCYSVYATHETIRDRGTFLGYAGARPELAQETLDRTLAEFRLLKNGIEMEELDRVKVGLKSALIMRQESTAVRAASISSDWYYLKRVRPISELQTAIDSLSIDSLLGYLERHPPIHFTVVTLGPQPLTIPV